MRVIVFDNSKFLQRQIVEALTCPINRHCTRLERRCDDWELWHNPEWLIQHFIDNGGAAAFARRREEFLRVVEVPEIEFEI